MSLQSIKISCWSSSFFVGEAVFVDDIPSPANCLYGAFIYSTKPLAWIKGIEFNSKSLPSGVTALLSYKDIPKCGQNIGSKTIFGSEPLFADEVTCCAGQLVAFVVILWFFRHTFTHVKLYDFVDCISFLKGVFMFSFLNEMSFSRLQIHRKTQIGQQMLLWLIMTC